MSFAGRVGYVLLNIAFYVLIVAIVAFWGQDSFVLLIAGGLLLVIGTGLLSSDPLAKKLKWKLLYSASNSGRLGVPLIMYGTTTLLTITRINLTGGIPISHWWLYPVMSVAALLVGIVVLLSRTPVKEM